MSTEQQPPDGFFETLGQMLGAAIRWIVEALQGFFTWLGTASHDFLEGLSSTLGISASVFSIAGLIIGLLMLIAAIRAFLHGAVMGGLIWLLLGFGLLSWLIY